MKRKSLLSLLSVLFLLLGMVSCSESEKYNTTVVRETQFSLNGSPWSLNLGLNTKCIYIYDKEGNYILNCNPSFRFTLPDGSYKIVVTPYPGDCIGETNASNLNDLYISQDSMADKTVMNHIQISAPVDYKPASGTPLVAQMFSRTGTLRLQALDDEKDMSYTTVRAIITTPRSAYKIADETYREEMMNVSRDKATPTGGRNYTDDFVLFPTESKEKGVKIRFEFLNNEKRIVKTKQIEGTYSVYKDSIQTLQFYLNNPDDNKAYILQLETNNKP